MPPALPALLQRFRVHVHSCCWWRTGPAWSIAPRQLGDTLLFIPVQGCAEIALGRRWRRCAAGTIAVLPDHEVHAARYAPGEHAWEVIAIHLHADDAWQAHFAAGFQNHVVPLAGHREWIVRLARLAGLFAVEPRLGEAHGHDLLRMLLAELLFAGAPVAVPPTGGDPRIAAALQRIAAEPGQVTVASLAKAANLSVARFRQVFHHAMGQAPKAFIAQRQLDHAAALLRDHRQSVRDVANECGFSSDHHFHRRFKERFAMTPSLWRIRGAGGP